MGELVHTSHVTIYQDKRPVRRAYIEQFETPVRYGVHGGIKEFYKMEPEEELPATLDHIVSAVAGWLTGTFGGALEARGISTQGNLWSETEGDIENVDGVMYITHIRVRYHVAVPPDKREAAERAVNTHKVKCPAAMSVERGIRVDISADVTEADTE